MNKWHGVAVAGLLTVSSAWAGSANHASVLKAPANLPKTRQAVARQQAEVTRLQHHISAEQARSQQAGEQLQQQDQTIAALRKQLQEVQAQSVNRTAR